MKTPAGRRPISRFNYLIVLGILIVAVAGLALPTVYSSSATSPSTATSPAQNAGSPSSITPQFRAWNWLSTIALPPAVAGESVTLYAADCATPKAVFNYGETVCAKTDGVDLTVPGNHYMNWIDSSLNQTNGGTITQNPQFFLFVPPTMGTWKATIGSVTPADSSIIGNPPLFDVVDRPGISTFTSPGCTTPKTTFTLGNGVLPGETVCAVARGGIAAPRRVAWIDPSGNARQVDAITADPESFSFTLPATQTSVVGGQTVDNRGNWKVNIISSRATVVATHTFVVTDALAPSADVSALKSSESSSASAGSNSKFFISVFNNGPNDAANVVLNDPLPADTTYYDLVQTSGPIFTCTTPNIGSAGTVNCTLASLPRNTAAQFVLIVQVDSGASTNSVITNTATVSSDDDDNPDNDSSSASVTVTGGGGGGVCTVACPDDIETPANTVDQSNNPGAIVHFSPPSGNTACGNITVDHCNDCFFPEGSTVVTGTAESGESCSFTVTVTAAGTGTTISCPSNKTADADASVCSTNVSVGTATATGTNVTVVGYRSDGLPMYTCDKFGNCVRSSDAPFPAGTTTITWYAYSHDVPGPYTGPTDVDGNPINEADTEEGHRTGSATCTQTVVVRDVTAPVIAATSSTVSADANCQAVIPDYSSTVTDNCACGSADDSEACEGHPAIVYTQTPAAGTPVGPGAHNVHIEATDGSEHNSGATKDVTFTVEDTTAPAIDCPDNISTTTDPGTCSAVVDPGTATATDNCDTSPTITWTRSDGQTSLSAPYPKGTTTITWRATDDEGNYSECAQTVTVADDEAPVINFNGQTPSMWPPNHDYRNFTTADFISGVSDNCDSLSVNDVYITKVTSDEAEESLTLGDGTTFNDMVIAANCKSVQLRAERVNTGNGRVYTIHFKLVDSSGNVTTGTAKVHSPRNRTNGTVDDGPVYTVTSSCP